MKIRTLLMVSMVALASCANAGDKCKKDCTTISSGSVITGTSSVPIWGWVSSNTYVDTFGNYHTINQTHSDTIPDLESAPGTLPAYKDNVLVWDGCNWQLGYRSSTDDEGEHWTLSSSGRQTTSGAHPMWQSLPDKPERHGKK